MRERDRALKKRRDCDSVCRHRVAHRRIICSISLAAGLLLAASVKAEPPAKPPEQPSGTNLETITVEAKRDRAILEHRVDKFVYGITVAPFEDSIAQWQKQTPICPLVAGLPRDDGEFILTRLSSIALAGGAPLGPASCKPNFYIIVTSQPDALLRAWNQHDTNMFGEQGSTKVRKFLHAPIPIRVWYNATLYTSEGVPLDVVPDGPLKGQPRNLRAMGFRLTRDEVRDLSSVIVLIDSGRLKGVTYGQLAAYIAMVGLAEIRLDAHLDDAPSILQLFSASGNTPPPALSPWDQAFIKALYHTEHTDPGQLGEIKISVVKELAP
jgi:hypothetical protein